MVNRNLADHDRDEITENLKKVKDYFNILKVLIIIIFIC